MTATEVVPRGEIQAEVNVAIERLSSPKKSERLEAARVVQLWSAYAASAAPALAQTLRAKDAELRVAAAQALEAIGQKARGASPALTAALSDPDPRVQAAAAFALVATPDDSANALAALRAVKAEHDARLALAVAAARRAFGARDDVSLQDRKRVAQEALPLLLTALSDPLGYEVRRLARAVAMVDLDVANTAAGELIAAASGNDPVAAGNAALALEAVGPLLRGQGSEFVRLAGEDSEEKRIQAIKSLGWLHIDTPASVAVLRRCLASSSPHVQIEAAGSLGRLGSPARAAVAELAHLVLRTKSSEVREAAALAVLRIDPSRCESLLREVEHKDPPLAERLRQLLALSRL